MSRSFKVAFVIGEVSGDSLAADLHPHLKSHIESRHMQLECIGLAGPELSSLGIRSLFPIDDIAVMGISAVFSRLPKLLSRIAETSRYIIDEQPDLVLLIDSPDFTHRVARRIRRSNPTIPIYHYVCPSVWAWRSYRAPRMRYYIDHIFSILPFESESLKKLNGPSCTYVGHPLVSSTSSFSRPSTALPDTPTLLVLPGSRTGEIRRLLPLFGDVLHRLHCEGHQFRAVLPAVPHLRDEIEHLVSDWSCPIEIVSSTDNPSTFSSSHLALAASGTVSLQLALYRVPMVIAYKLDIFVRSLAPFLRTAWSIVLPNLITGSPIVPEYINSSATVESLTNSLVPLLSDTPERFYQLSSFDIVEEKMRLSLSSGEIISIAICDRLLDS